MIYKKITFFLLFALSTLSSYSQTTFQQTYGGTSDDYAWDVKITSDGGYIIAGQTASFGAGGTDAWLIKTNADGDTLWQKTYGGIGNEVARAVQQTSDGGYIFAGETTSFGTGGYDLYVVKTDANGDTLWSRAFGGSGNEHAWTIVQMSDSGYAISGYGNSFGQGADDSYLMRLDKNGNMVWIHSYGGSGGNGSNEAAEGLYVTPDGKFIMAGYTSSFSEAVSNAYVVKVDTDGSIIWTKVYLANDWSYALKVIGSKDGGYVFAGATDAFGAGGFDMYLFKTDTAGNVLWSQTYGSSNGSDDDRATNLQQTSDGGYIVTGNAENTGLGLASVVLLKTDSAGNEQWTEAYGGSGDDGSPAVIGSASGAVQQTTDGGYILAAGTQSFGDGGWDFYLIKTDSLGNSGCKQLAITMAVDSPITPLGTGGLISTGGTLTDAATQVTAPALVQDTLCMQIPIVCTLSVTAGAISATCGLSNGSAIAQLTGGTAPYKYLWNTFPVQNTDTATGLDSGIYIVTVTDTNNCSATATDTVTNIGAFVAASVTISPSATHICAGTPITFTAAPTNGGTPSYQWQVNKLNVGTDNYTYIDSACNNNDTVTCVMTSNASCVTGSPATSDSIILTVDSQAVAGIITALHDTVCDGTEASLSVTGSTGNVQWQQSSTPGNFTNISGATTTSYYIAVDTQTTYFRVFASSGICPNDTSTVFELTVNPSPPPPFITQSHDTLYCSTNPTYTSYQWYDSTAMISGATDTFYVATHNGNYNMKVTDKNGCNIAVGINVIIMGISSYSLNEGELQLYPNPVEKQFTIHNSQFTIKEIEIYNVLGQVCLLRSDDGVRPADIAGQSEITNPKSEIVIDVSGFAKGIYLIRLTNESTSWVGKFEKE